MNDDLGQRDRLDSFGSLFLTLPARLLTGQIGRSSAFVAGQLF
jgi:hypothetical protein